MATKKQKRSAALAKREAYMEEYRRTGLEAQKADREDRAKRAEGIKAASLAEKERLETILKKNPKLTMEQLAKERKKDSRRPRGIVSVVPEVVFSNGKKE